ncbi:hypothetical protein MKW98_021488 [Papaver atlanticum]|uniref:Uncharacterized protein n=1 Tax=Papaver atlanticum TaxID=357466 RepID=A0AAD4SS02_9MAGN|nr:hypothetical protein MKW98_021488 [Papaver atlanticum]
MFKGFYLIAFSGVTCCKCRIDLLWILKKNHVRKVIKSEQRTSFGNRLTPKIVPRSTLFWFYVPKNLSADFVHDRMCVQALCT